MYINKIRIQNYKSIKEMDLEFSKGKNVIVGQNNVGKSNIISAINLLIGEKFPLKVYENNFYHKDNNEFFISLKLSECAFFDKEYWENYNKSIGVYKITSWGQLKKSSNGLDEERIEVFWKKSNDIIEIIESAECVYISLYSKINEECVYSLTIKNGNLYYRLKFFSKEMIASFLTSAIIPSERSIKNELIINDYSWYGKLIKNIWNGKILDYQEKIDVNNQNLSQITDEIFDDLTHELDNSVKDAIPYNSISFKLIQDTKSDFYKGIKILLDDGYYSLLDNKGSGIKSLVIIELFKLYCKKYHLYSSCLIIEEPEVFLHPHARSVLSKKIDQFNDNDKNQTIITTHSEQFISNFNITQLIFVNKENGESKAYKINQDDFLKKDFEKMNIISSSENAEMFFSDFVILVEGGEKYIIKKLIEIYYNELILDYNNVSIIKVGGKSYFEIYKEMLEKLNKKVYIIGDYDNLDSGLTQFIEKRKGVLNKIKSTNRGLLAYDELCINDRSNLDLVFEELKNKNIYVLHKGALESYFNSANVNELKSREQLSGKEVIAHYIASIVSSSNVNYYLDIKNDFMEYINCIIEDIICECQKEKMDNIIENV